jgi:hypothetical protein
MNHMSAQPIPPVIATPQITNRADFFAMLATTIADIDGFVAREPAYPVWGLLQRQLHAMRAWSDNGATPSPEQRARVSIGLVASRELEPPADQAMDNLVTRLHLLNYYWRRWPAVGG